MNKFLQTAWIVMTLYWFLTAIAQFSNGEKGKGTRALLFAVGCITLYLLVRNVT